MFRVYMSISQVEIEEVRILFKVWKVLVLQQLYTYLTSKTMGIYIQKR